MSLVEHLETTRALPSDALRAAFLETPRHCFLPELNLNAAYEDKAIAIKERDGVVISSISQPSMIAHMLALLDVHPGNSVLEIGTGSGYTAALLGALAGPSGAVTTLDIEYDLIAEAREHLSELQIDNVNVLHGDALGTLEMPFDRIIVTARNDDIEHDWWRLLANDGRIVVPLDIGYGGERAYGFVRENDRLLSIGSTPCAFIALRFPGRRASDAAPMMRVLQPIRVIAMEHKNAHPDLTSGADVVIVRPQTVFAVSGFTS